MEVHQRRVAGEIVIRGVNAKVGISNGGMRHIQRIDNLVKIRGRTIRGDVVSENDERLDGGEKSEMHCIFNQKNQRIT